MRTEDTPQIYAELRRHEDDSLTGIVTIDEFYALPPHVAAANTPHLFVRSPSGERVELGTMLQHIRALSLGVDRRRARLIVGAQS